MPEIPPRPQSPPEAARLPDGLCAFPVPERLPAGACPATARSGETTLIVNGRHVHSAYRPGEEARRIVAGHATAKAAILFGFGLGHVALAWQHEKARPLLALEAVPALLAAPEPDLAPLAAGPTTVATEPDRETFLRFFRSLAAAEIKQLAWLETPGAVSLAPERYAAWRRLAADCLRQFLTDFYTELEFERLWFRNILANAPLIAARPHFAELTGSITGRTAVIIGAGPSLDRQHDWLARAATHCVLFATDTALRNLLARGIKPDYVVSLDGQIHNLHDFTGLETADLALLADTTVYPAIPRLPFRSVHFFETAEIVAVNGQPALISHPLALWIKQVAGETGAARSGGNVTTSAIELARLMGAARIILAGCDFGYPDWQTHARGTPAAERLDHARSRTAPPEAAMHRILSRRAVIRSVDNRGQSLVSDIIMAKYAAWTAAAAEEAGPALEWLTLSPEALAIPGITLTDPDTALGLVTRRTHPAPRTNRPALPASATTGVRLLSERLGLLRAAIENVLVRSRPLPEPDDLITLFGEFPFLRRGYGAQLLHLGARSDDAFLLGEIRFQLQRTARVLARLAAERERAEDGDQNGPDEPDREKRKK